MTLLPPQYQPMVEVWRRQRQARHDVWRRALRILNCGDTKPWAAEPAARRLAEAVYWAMFNVDETEDDALIGPRHDAKKLQDALKIHYKALKRLQASRNNLFAIATQLNARSVANNLSVGDFCYPRWHSIKVADELDLLLANELEEVDCMLPVTPPEPDYSKHAAVPRGDAAVAEAALLLGPERAKDGRKRGELAQLAAVLFGEPERDMHQYVERYRAQHGLQRVRGTGRVRPKPPRK